MTMLRRPRFLLCLSILALGAFQPAYAADLCGEVHGGQFADEQLCASIARFPDGKAATAAMLDSIPENYPWLFPPIDQGSTPQLTIKVLTAGAQFSTLQILNGWSPYDTTGGEANQFKNYGRAKDIVIESASGHSLRHTLRDTDELQTITLPKPAAAEWVSMKVLSTYPGKREMGAVRWFAIAWEADEGQ